ncbi:recombinase family protein [Ruegeria sp.]|uniref:recombinase family protein n=1 Tax=Ruegeria sp. TaxID=1879320 RepID=UPI003B003EF6
MIIGYARVSTDDQNLDSQTDALSAAGAEKVFADRISGSKRARSELDKMCREHSELSGVGNMPIVRFS